MAIPDPLLDQEPFVEQETLVVTREWYSWLGLLIAELKIAIGASQTNIAALQADLTAAQADITAIQATLADHEARITALEPP